MMMKRIKQASRNLAELVQRMRDDEVAFQARWKQETSAPYVNVRLTFQMANASRAVERLVTRANMLTLDMHSAADLAERAPSDAHLEAALRSVNEACDQYREMIAIMAPFVPAPASA